MPRAGLSRRRPPRSRCLSRSQLSSLSRPHHPRKSSQRRQQNRNNPRWRRSGPRRAGLSPAQSNVMPQPIEKLFDEVVRLMSEGLSLTAATQRLAEDGRVAGVGTPISRARRLAKPIYCRATNSLSTRSLLAPDQFYLNSYSTYPDALNLRINTPALAASVQKRSRRSRPSISASVRCSAEIDIVL